MDSVGRKARYRARGIFVNAKEVSKVYKQTVVVVCDRVEKAFKSFAVLRHTSVILRASAYAERLRVLCNLSCVLGNGGEHKVKASSVACFCQGRAYVVTHNLSAENICNVKLVLKSLNLCLTFLLGFLIKLSADGVSVDLNADSFCLVAYFLCHFLLSVKSVCDYIRKLNSIKAHFLCFCNTVKLCELSCFNILIERIRTYRNFHFRLLCVWIKIVVES